MRYIFFCLSVACFLPAKSQLQLNEVCARNHLSLVLVDGSTPDWVELLNTGTVDVELSEYSLSDDYDELDKWTFPSHLLEPGKFIIVLASGDDKIDGYIHTSFKLDADGESVFLSRAGLIQEELTYSEIQADHSYGIQAAATHYFEQSTPLAPNSETAYNGYSSTPIFQLAQGFYPDAINLAINATGEIRYTLDGNIPTASSELYSEPIIISNTSAIRVRTFASTLLPSEVVSGSYFINEQAAHSVVSIIVEPDSLFDPLRGIYMPGPNADTIYPYYGSNFWEDRNVASDISMFDENKEELFQLSLGLQMHGGTAARTLPMKPFRLISGNRYASSIKAKIFDNKALGKFDRLVLRNSGSDFNRTMYRDGILHNLMLDSKLEIDMVGYKPALVYINGVYWGFYNIREKVDRFYLNNNSGIDEDEVDLIEEDKIIIAGSDARFNTDLAEVLNAPWGSAQLYTLADTYFDLPSLTDYIIAETFFSNSDWPANNMKYWRPHIEGAKWRFILFDLDACMGLHSWTGPESNAIGGTFSIPGDTTNLQLIFNAVNSYFPYRNSFLNRYADLINSIFEPEYLNNYLLDGADLIAPLIPAQYKKWNGQTDEWTSEINAEILPFASARAEVVRGQLVDWFELEGTAELNLNIYPQQAGTITVNSLDSLALPWNGIYFKNVPVSITVHPNPGYKFLYWETKHRGENQQTAEQITFTPFFNEFLTAQFEISTESPSLVCRPNPTTGLVKLEFTLAQSNIISIKVISANGEMKFFETLDITSGHYVLDRDFTFLTEGIYHIVLSGKDFSSTSKMLRIR